MEERNLPPLFSENGTWDENRKEEVRSLFASQVFGEGQRDGFGTTWKVRYEEEIPKVGTETVYDITVHTPKGPYLFPLYLYTAVDSKTPAPVLLYIGNRPRNQRPASLPAAADLEEVKEALASAGVSMENLFAGSPAACDLEHTVDQENWPVTALLERGFATAAFYTEDLEPDYETDLKQGIIHMFDDVDQKEPNRWRAIAAWAFGTSRAIDCLSGDARLDSNHIAVIGHSRGGKTALWCTANDPRVSCCYANNSGCTGAALSRGKRGEKLWQINTIFPYWFCDNYKKYNEKEETLPVDQHMLLALAAPRPLYLASATRDLWSDPESEFLSAVAASPAYEACGVKGLAGFAMPKPNIPCHGGMIGYHVREGGHALLKADWLQFCDFWRAKIEEEQVEEEQVEEEQINGEEKRQ